MSVDFNEIILTAIDTLVTKKIQSINYDYTDTYTILNNDEKEKGKYLVTDGVVNFYAYSSVTNYNVGDVVYVTIPNNDFNQQKTIIGKQVSDDSSPFVYTQPFDTIIDISNNLITDNLGETGLLANDPTEHASEYNNITEQSVGKKLIWAKDFSNDILISYTMLGLQAQFKAWLNDMDTIDGDYGLKLLLTCKADNNTEQCTLYESGLELLDNADFSLENWKWIISNINLQWSDSNFTDLQAKYPNYLTDEQENNSYQAELLDLFNRTNNWQEYWINDLTTALKSCYKNYELTFSCKDMYGNPYNFESFYQQEVVFDISNFGQIIYAKLYFYQEPGSFVSNTEYIPITLDAVSYENNTYYIYKDNDYYLDDSNTYVQGITYYKLEKTTIPYQDFLGNLLLDNIFVKDPYFCVGYKLSDFENEQVVLYTINNSNYSNQATVSDEDNKKEIHLRWLHQLDNGNIIVVSDQTDLDYTINWYRKELGAAHPDAYAGVDWEKVNEDNEDRFTYILQPNTSLNNESVKAVVVYNDKPYYSNVLTFNTLDALPNYKTLEVNNALNLICGDDTYGNYLIYDQGNKLLDSAESSVIRALKCYFYTDITNTNSNGPLKEAEYIEWRIPVSNTMIKLNTRNTLLEALDYNTITSKGLYTIEQLNSNKLNEVGGWQTQKYLLNTETFYNGYWSGYMYDKTTDEIVIIWKGDPENSYAINYILEYSIGNYYSSNYTNNTISCTVIKNNLTYQTQKEFSFGVAGTTGTDYTLVIDFDNNETAISQFGEEYYNTSANAFTDKVPVADRRAPAFTARLYDYSNQEIDTSTREVTWTWEWTAESVIPDSWNKTLTTDGDDNIVAYSGTSQNTNHITLTDWMKVDVKTHLLYLKVTLSGWGDYDLSTVLPVPIRLYNEGKDYAYYTGPSTVTYPSVGYPSYYSNPCQIHQRLGDIVSTGKWEIFNPWEEDSHYIGNLSKSYDENGNELSSYILQPASLYVSAAHQYGLQYKVNNQVVWNQPIYTTQNIYPAGALNDWDGNSIVENETDGTIIAQGLAAGKKNSDNTFSGVLLGNWNKKVSSDISTNTGIYGFYHGAMSYGILDDGTAFLGESGKGRILFDGNNSTITSAGFKLSDKSGVRIDLDSAPYLWIKGHPYDPDKKTIINNTVNDIIKITDGSGSSFLQSANYPEKTSGLKIDLNKGTLDAIGDFKLTAKNDNEQSQIRISTENPYFYIKDSKLNPLIYLSDSSDYIQSANYITKNSGTYLNLDDGVLKMRRTSDDIKEKYITLGVQSDSYALTIGSNGNDNELTNSNFKVDWNGNATMNNAYLSGTIESQDGHIGGWIISESALSSKDGTTVLNKSTGIYTNYITIKEGTITYGTMGKTTSSLIIDDNKQSSSGIGLCYTDNNSTSILKVTEDSVGMSTANGYGYLSIYQSGSTIGISIGGNKLKVNGIAAENQYGIYARFA